MDCARILVPMLGLLALAVVLAEPAEAKTLSLAGTWRFRLDPERAGLDGRWFASDLPDRIKLPGSTDEAGYGTPNNRPADFNRLSRVVEYTGPAWYQRTVDIPEAWRGKRITLHLERCHWETRVWVDGQPYGMRDSLCVPHEYELSGLAPGKRRLTIRVDNMLKFNMGPDAHSTSEQTQTNWNGIIGRIELRAADPVWVESVQVYPDAAAKTARVVATLGNATGRPVSGTLTLAAESRPAGHRVPSMEVPVTLEGETATVEAVLPMGADARLWDEFAPNTYRLTATLEANTFRAEHETSFGLRDLTLKDGGFAVNGRRIFLRGTLDCCVYPLTGYPPTTREGWERVFKVVKSYGLNHVRYHSWCPPEAAFEAADRLGVYLQVEAPWWAFDAGQDPPRDAFIAAEVRRILDTYGNHPSFAFFCNGNELEGESAFLQKLVRFGKEHDPRHLYAPSTWHTFGDEDQFRVTTVRGLHGDSTDRDFRKEASEFPVPLVSHEIGQWTVYPKLDEIRKYTGVTRARNFERVRDDLKAKGMLEQAKDFTRASGKLSAELYKEEVEVMLRTGHGGFQLLDLHDFPGQGTALVGILDAFWDSKGLISPEDWRRFCGPTVPLARLARRAWTTDETLSAAVEVAHYGPEDIKDARPAWTLTDDNGRTLARGDLTAKGIPTGAVAPLGALSIPLAGITAPAHSRLTVSVGGAANDWSIWVYPPAAAAGAPDGVLVTRSWEEARAALAAGGRVLLLPEAHRIVDQLPGSFTPVFWSPIWFRSGARTMGILCDPNHPALSAFPTDEHTDWQWHDLLTRSETMVLDSLPGVRPVVQVIDNFARNHRLGNIFEARVGNGRLLVCSLDLATDLEKRPAAAQMRRSLLAYAASDAFQPTTALDEGQVSALFWDRMPLEAMRGAPDYFEGAALDVRAAGGVTEMRKSAPWAASADEVLARQDGFGYSVLAGTWKDEVGSSWHAEEDLAVTVECPQGFTGTFFVHLHDWNSEDRVADIRFESRRLGILDRYDGPGVWLGIPVFAEDSADGRLELSVRPRGHNAMITRITLIPDA